MLEKSNTISIDPGTKQNDFCEPCLNAKLTRGSFPKSLTHTTRHGEVVFSDLAVLPCVGYGGWRYFVTYIDHFTRHLNLFLLKSKSDQFQAFKEYQAIMFTRFSTRIHKLESLQSDNGGEYLSNEMQQYMTDQGIHHRRRKPRIERPS
jgi:hypothetical protein